MSPALGASWSVSKSTYIDSGGSTVFLDANTRPSDQGPAGESLSSGGSGLPLHHRVSRSNRHAEAIQLFPGGIFGLLAKPSDPGHPPCD